MVRLSTRLGPLAFVALTTACGGSVVFDPGPTDGGGTDDDGADSTTDAGATSGAGGGNTDTTGSGHAGGGAQCQPPPAPSPTPPTGEGCFSNDGEGWLAVPCVCDLWMTSYFGGPSTVTVHLDVTPADQVPSLGGPIDVEVAFEDRDQAWYAVWSAQPGNGDAFAVSTSSGRTFVRMGRSSVTLDPAPLDACGSRTAQASVSGPSYTTLLSMHAVIDDGSDTVTDDGSCTPPPPPNPPPPR